MRERDDTKDRFLAAIAASIDPDAVAEAHFFQPIKQGGTESCVAVIAVQESKRFTGAEGGPESVTGREADAESLTGAEGGPENFTGREADAANFTGREADAENFTGAEGAAENSPAAAKTPAAAAESDLSAENRRFAENVENRLVIYTAKYRLTLKGPDRGKWEFAIHAEADAPLVTVDRVVQGVQRRSGDAEGPERLSGEEFRSWLPPSQPAKRSVV